MTSNWLDIGLSKDDEAFVRKNGESYRATQVDTIDTVLDWARAIEKIRTAKYGTGVQGGFVIALVQYGFVDEDDDTKPIDAALRSNLKEMLDKEESVRAFWQGADAKKKRNWRAARSIYRNWKASLKPKTPKAPKVKPGPAPFQPLTEEELRARSGMKPSPAHIEKAAQKQAAEAEAEAKKLRTVEAEADKLRERVRLAELAKEALESEVEELKAARTDTAPPTPKATSAKPPFEMKEVSKGTTWRAYVDGNMYYDINLRQGTYMAIGGGGGSKDYQEWEVTKYVGKVNFPYKGWRENETSEKGKARSERNTKAREQAYPKALAIAQRDYERYK
jgi:hypothetical protein